MTTQIPIITRGHLSLVYSAPVRTPAATGRSLTSRDMITLQGWMRQQEPHGFTRMVIEAGDGYGEPEEGGYALLYEPLQDWASWGVRREGDVVVVWHCGGGTDTGRYETMQEALDSLPVTWRRASRSRDMAPRRDGRSTVVRLA